MKYVSTRGATAPLGFSEVVMAGLAPDGGLFLPEYVPDVRNRLSSWRSLSYQELAFEIIRVFADIPEGDLRVIVEASYSGFDHPEVTPVVRVGPVYVLELFHGPTLAFKDVALQFLGRLFDYLLQSRKARLNIVAATSGDTGSAAIYGVRGRKRMRIFVMHPQGRISEIQQRQMTSVLDENVFNIAVAGTFDDCQRILKALFVDLDFKQRYCLGSVNSINWARLVVQIVYYFYAAFRVMEKEQCKSVRFAVPTGNFGDIFAGYLAAQMGLPISRLILATNENDILKRFFTTGEYRRGKVCTTISPAMDIQVASNFERYLYYRLNQSASAVAALMRSFESTGCLTVEPLAHGRIDSLIAAGSADTASTLGTIRHYYEQYGYLLDPHTAVGVKVASAFVNEATDPLVSLSTAHPAKFPEAIIRAVGRDVARHPSIDRLKAMPTRLDVLPAELPVIREYIRQRAEAN